MKRNEIVGDDIIWDEIIGDELNGLGRILWGNQRYEQKILFSENDANGV